MIINEIVFVQGGRKDFDYEISFFHTPNVTESIQSCETILIPAWNFNSLSFNIFKKIIDLNKRVILDFTYEMIDPNVVLKLAQYDNLENVEYYCNDRGLDYELEQIPTCLNKGLKLYMSQFFIDNQDEYCPIIKKTSVPQKKFIMYTGKTRPERTLMVALLSYYDLIKYGYVSYFGDNHNLYYKHGKTTDVYELADLKTNIELVEKVKIGLEKLSIPLTIDVNTLSYETSHSKNFLANYYQASDFAIVLETEYDNNFFVTEKTIKCILCNKKFIVFACQGFIKKLKEYYLNKLGIDISHLTDWCDTSYDNEPNKILRAELIINEVIRQIEKGL